MAGELCLHQIDHMSVIECQISGNSNVCATVCLSVKASKVGVTVHCEGNHQWLEDNPHKGPVTQKIFLCYDVMLRIFLLTYTKSHLGILLKIHVHGFFDTVGSMFNWHIEDRCQTIHWSGSLSHTNKSHTRLLCMHVWKLGFPMGFQHGWMWFGYTVTGPEFVPVKSLAKCTMISWTRGGNQWDSFVVVQLKW